jgi:phage N-6-adenine-methyltransferase
MTNHDLKTVFSSAKTGGSDCWGTPRDFFFTLDAEFQFTVDVCATKENALCQKFFTPEDDGLRQRWEGVAWMNPPYSDVKTWIAKAYAESRKGATVVCLVPSRTDTAWFHDFVMPYAETRFVRGRLKFGGSRNSAPFPSMLAIFRPPTPSAPGPAPAGPRETTVYQQEAALSKAPPLPDVLEGVGHELGISFTR